MSRTHRAGETELEFNLEKYRRHGVMHAEIEEKCKSGEVTSNSQRAMP